MVWLQNGENVKEAYNIFRDLLDKYPQSSICLNGLAAALICMGQYEEAEGFLQDALLKVCFCAFHCTVQTVVQQFLSKICF